MSVRSNWGQRKRVPVTLPADLEAELERVCKAAPPPPSDGPIYKYLSRVYRLQRKIASSSDWQKVIQRYRGAHASRTSKKYPSVVIKLTAGDHITSNMKYKYVTALEYAFANNVQSKNLKAFIKRQGGLNKCVKLWSKKTWWQTSKKVGKENP
jgi:hypothetical protein